MDIQLSLLPLFDVEKVTDAANELLDMLNEGRPKKDRYDAAGYFYHRELYILRAEDKLKQALFNVLNAEGKTPEGLCANWRNFSHIKQELNL